MKKRKLRSARGAGLLYGVFAVAGIVIAGTTAVVLLLNVGYGTLYDEKLARVNTYAAQYAAAHAQDGASEGEIKAYTENLMLAMGLTPNNVSINITRTTTNYGPSVQVTVANRFGLVGSRGLLPTQITLQNTAASASGSND